MKAKVLKAGCFCILLFLFFGLIRNVFMFKSRDGIYTLKRFYEQEENSIDLLILGSSHTTVDIDSAMLWDQYGIASYTLWGSGQPMWNTYYYMKEALKTQSPKLIILEGYTLTSDNNYGDQSSVIKNTYGLKWSQNKMDAIKASVPKSKYVDYMVEIGQYHNRYSEIDKNDFGANTSFPYIKEYKETEMSFGLYPSNIRPDIAAYQQSPVQHSMTKKNERYYRACIELAQEYGIPIMVVVSPYPVSAEDYAIFTQAEQIANEYGVQFVNGNNLYDVLGIDFSQDFADADHLNYSGCLKWTSYLGKVIDGTFSLPDRSKDEKYQSWEVNAQHINQMIYNHKFLYTGMPKQYIETIAASPHDYTVVVSLDGDYNNEEIDLSGVVSKYFNIPKSVFNKGKEGTWIIQDGKTIWSESGKEYFYHMQLGENDLSIEKSVGEPKQIIFNNVNQKKVKDGINILVYDNFTNMFVESVGFNAEGNYNCIK